MTAGVEGREVNAVAIDALGSYEAIAAEITESGVATAGKMFGMPTLKTRGNRAFAGLYRGAMVFKLDSAARERALGLPGACQFDPMGGRPMKEWVVVPAEHAAEWCRLAEAALAYVIGAA